MLKRVLSLLLSIVMVLSAVPFQVFAEEIAPEETQQVELSQEEIQPEVTETETVPEETAQTEQTEAGSPETQPEISVTVPETLAPEEPEAEQPQETQPEIPEDRDSKTITPDGDDYQFETFEDLKTLAAGTYSRDDYVAFEYVGTETLVIKESLTLPKNVSYYLYDADVVVPAGVTLTMGEGSYSFYVNSLTVKGTFRDAYSVYWGVETRLEVSGRLETSARIELDLDTVLIGRENIYLADEYAGIVRQCYVDTAAELKAAMAQAAGDPSMDYDIGWSEYGHLTLTESVVVPANATIYIYAYSFTIPQGVTLELRSRNINVLSCKTYVEGSLIHNGRLLTVDGEGRLTIRSTGSYSGTGSIEVDMYYHNLLEDAILGLDLSQFEITEEYGEYSIGKVWLLKPIPKNKLANPTNLQWSANGWVSWNVEKPNQGKFEIVLYREGYGEIHRHTLQVGNGELSGNTGELPYLVLKDPQSGSYYFTIQSKGDGITASSSDVVTSGTWKYTKPAKQVATCTNLYWNWPTAKWTSPDGSELQSEVRILFAQSKDQEPENLGVAWGATAAEGFRLWDWVMQQYGPGYYYFQVRAISDDITKKCNATWSAMSPAYHYDPYNQAVQDPEYVKDAIMGLSPNAGKAYIRSEIARLDNEQIRYLMLTDGEVLDALMVLEMATGGTANIEVRSGVPFAREDVLADNISLNTPVDDKKAMTLVVDKISKAPTITSQYDKEGAVGFSLTLENHRGGTLDIPIVVSLPVPDGIQPEYMTVLRSHNGTVSQLSSEELLITQDNGKTVFLLIIDELGDFVIVHKAPETLISGSVSQIKWAITDRGQLVISGKGAMPNETAPWKAYSPYITSIRVEEGITAIGSSSFEELDQVTKVTLPGTLTYIGDWAFYYCASLESITLPKSLSDMGNYLFVGCLKLKEILVEQGNPWFYSKDGVFYSKAVLEGETVDVLVAYPTDKAGTSFTVPDAVDIILDGAFVYNEKLTSVTLPRDLMYISNYAFAYSALKSISIPEYVDFILQSAFEGCENLSSIYFRGNPPLIYGDAFAGVTAIAYYPASNANWTKDVMQSYGGSLQWQRSDYVEITGGSVVMGGESLTLTARIYPYDYSYSKITWSLAPGDEAYASLKADGKKVTVTAVDVSEPHTITVIATTDGRYDSCEPCAYSISIQPQIKALELYEVVENEQGEKEFVYVGDDEWRYWFVNAKNPQGIDVHLMVNPLPMGSAGEITWSSSNSKVATVDKYGYVSFTGKAGSTVITAAAANGVKTSITYKAIDPIYQVEPVGDIYRFLVGGKSETFKVRNADTGKDVNKKNVQWSLWMPQGDPSAYATINSSGKLTTKKVVEETTFYVYGDVYTDGVLTGYVTYSVTLFPATTQLELYYDEELVNGKTVYFDLNTQDSLILSAKLLPDGAMPMPVEWYTSDGKNSYAEYIELGVDDLVMIGNPTGKTGTVTMTAKAADGTGKKATVKVQFGRFAQSVEILNRETTLDSGKSMTLKASVGPWNVSKPTVTWSLADPADKAYVTLSGSKLTAKTVYDRKTVTVIATSKDGMASDSIDITITPKADLLAIYDATTGKNVTKGTIVVDVNNRDRDVYLTAKNFYDGSDARVTWNYKDAYPAYFYEENGCLVVYMANEGSTTVTAKSGSRTATVTIKAVSFAKKLDITTKNGKNLIWDSYGNKLIQVASGKSVDLKVNVTGDASNKVTWSILEGKEYAKLTSSGKLTANKNISSVKEVVVQAVAADGSGVSSTITVLVKPLAIGLKIYTLEEDVEKRTIDLHSNTWKNNRSNTTLLWDMGSDSSFQIYSAVYPYYENNLLRSAIQDVTWKSSSPKVASVSSSGMVTCLKPGTTTITATAADGSGQKISFKLTVIKLMTGISLEQASVAGGKSITLKPVIRPADTTNKNLFWTLTGDTAFASIDQKGKLTTKKVTAVKTVYVYAFSQDGSNVYGVCEVKIYPKAVSSVKIYRNGLNVTGDTISATDGRSFTLSAITGPDGASPDVTWKSSDDRYVYVSDGYIRILAHGKTVTITVTAKDGSGKKATVKIKT